VFDGPGAANVVAAIKNSGATRLPIVLASTWAGADTRPHFSST
jgi:hypothetical protein